MKTESKYTAYTVGRCFLSMFLVLVLKPQLDGNSCGEHHVHIGHDHVSHN